MLVELKLAGSDRQSGLSAGHGGDPLTLAYGVWEILVELVLQAFFVVPCVDLRRATVHVQIDD